MCHEGDLTPAGPSRPASRIEAPAWSHQLLSYVFSEGPKKTNFRVFPGGLRSVPADVVSDGDDRRVPKARTLARLASRSPIAAPAAPLLFLPVPAAVRIPADVSMNLALDDSAIAGNGEETEHLSGRLSASGGGWWRFRRSQVEKLPRADRGFCGGSASVCRTPWLTAVPRRVPRRVIAFLRDAGSRSCACFLRLHWGVEFTWAAVRGSERSRATAWRGGEASSESRRRSC